MSASRLFLATALTLGVGLAAMAPAAATCGAGKTAGSWAVSMGLVTCDVVVAANGSFPAAPCLPATLPSSSGVAAAVLAEAAGAGITPSGTLTGSLRVDAACKVIGKATFVNTEGKSFTMTISGRSDVGPNLFLGTGINTKTGAEVLIPVGGFRK